MDTVTDTCMTVQWPINKKTVVNQQNGIQAVVTVAAVSFYSTV